jgi:hypothetical protein
VAGREGQCAPSHQATRHTPAPGKAAGGPRRDSTPQAKSSPSRLKIGYGCPRQRRGFVPRGLELAEGTSLRGLRCHCADKAGKIYSAPLYIFRVVLLLLQQRLRPPLPPFFSRVLPASRLFLRASFRTCRWASAVTRRPTPSLLPQARGDPRHRFED